MNLERVKKIFDLLYSIAILLLLVVAILVIFSNIPIPGGYRFYTVQSGSMAPAIPVGSVVAVFPKTNYQKGDVVTFTSKEGTNPTTHRILAIEDNQTVKTKGDANDIADPGVIKQTQIVGKVELQIPLIGYLLNFTKTQSGLIILVIIPATLIVFTEILNIKNEIFKLLKKSDTVPIVLDQKIVKKNIKKVPNKKEKK